MSNECKINWLDLDFLLTILKVSRYLSEPVDNACN